MRKIIPVFVVLFVSIVLLISIFFWGEQFGLTHWSTKVLAWFGLLFILLFIIFLPVMFRSLWAASSNEASDKKHLNPDFRKFISLLKKPREPWLMLLRQQSRLSKPHLFGSAKPWLFVVSSPELIRQTLPELEQAHWVETQDAFWINGTATPPAKGWHSLKGFYRKPVEAVVLLCRQDTLLTIDPSVLSGQLKALGWLPPVNIVCVDQDMNSHAYITCHLGAQTVQPELLAQSIQALADQTAGVATRAIEHDRNARFAAQLSAWLGLNKQRVAEKLQQFGLLLPDPRFLQQLSFISCRQNQNAASLIFPTFSGGAAMFRQARKLRFSIADRIFTAFAVGCMVFTSGMLVSCANNRGDIAGVQQAVQREARSTAQDLKNLQALQKEIASIEAQQLQFGSRVVRSFGLNKQTEVLQSALSVYSELAQQLFIKSAQQRFAQILTEVNNAPVDADSQNGESGYGALKAYLMLTQYTAKAEPEFLAKNIARALENQPGYSPIVQEIARFYAAHLPSQPQWKLVADDNLIRHSRQTITQLIGTTQADEQVYMKILEQGKQKYPEISLADLIQKDFRGIWQSSRMLPGVFTQKAWDEYVKAAFTDASKGKGGSLDWVLGATENDQAVKNVTLEKLKERYFQQYSEAWYAFLNGITWVPQHATLDIANQLHVYADPQRSPLVALFGVIQANGNVDAQQVGLADTFVSTAKKIVDRNTGSAMRGVASGVAASQQENIAAERQALEQRFASPLRPTFAPLIQLVDANINPKSELSLQRYLERVAAAKQKLLKIADAADMDGMARVVVQDILAGKSNEFTDGADYARLLETGVGDGLSTFAKNVFVQPFQASWNAIVIPAQTSINGLWRQSVVLPWGADMEGRYPLNLTENEVAIPVLGKYLLPQQGIVDHFINSQLAGVLTLQGDQWVENPNQLLQIDPVFLSKMNQLSRIARNLFVQGDAGYSFELRAIPTAEVTHFELQIDGQTLHYFNQKPEWQPFKWPGDPLHAGAQLTWETESAGLRKNLSFKGRWGFIRMLSQSRITPLDRATYLVEWRLNDQKLLRYQLRATAGKGPLELIELQNFHMPARIFAG